MHSKQEVREQIKQFLSERVGMLEAMAGAFYKLHDNRRGTLVASWQQIDAFRSGSAPRVAWMYLALQTLLTAPDEQQAGFEDVVALLRRYTPPTQFVVTVLEERAEGVEVHVYRLATAFLSKAPEEVQ